MGDLIFNIIPVIWENSIQAMKTLLINKIIVTVLGILFSIASYALPGIAEILVIWLFLLRLV
jgi:hypothetical protein